MSQFVRILSLAVVATVIGCGGDSTSGSNAPPSVDKSGPAGEKSTGKTPEGKKGGTNAPQGADSLKAL